MLNRPKIRLGLEATSAVGEHHTGIAHYTVNLVKALLKNPDFDEVFALHLLYRLSRYKIRHLRFLPKPGMARWYQKGLWPIIKNYDLIHCADTRLTGWNNIPHVVTVHDLAIFKSQFQYEEFSPASFREKRFHEYREAAQKARAVIVDSISTKNDFIEIMGCLPDKIDIISLGLDSELFRPCRNPEDGKAVRDRYGLGFPYLLFAGAITVRKNLVNLIKAYSLSKVSSEFHLVLAGNLSHGSERVKEALQGSSRKENIHLIGYTPAVDLPYLYSGATAFLFPTYYEGFGLPILEAMACGTPVLTGNIGAAPETAGGHGLLVDPFDIDSIAFGIDKVLTIPPTARDKAREYALSFTWARCAEKTIEVYRSVLGS